MGLLRRRAVVLIALVCLALALRLVAAALWQARLPEEMKFGFGDSESYWRLGQTIAHGEPYQYGTERVFRTPGYPLILAALFYAAGDEPPVFWGRVVTALVSSLAVVGVFWLGRQLFDERAAWLAALAVACYPGLVVMGALVLSEGPFCAVLPLQLACWIKGWRAESSRHRAVWLLLAGVAAGVATLIRPAWLLFTPFAVGLAVLFSPERKRHLLAGGWVMLGLCLVMAPWWIRNYQVTGHFVLTTLQVGASLYDGISPTATGASEMSFVPVKRAELRRHEAEQPTASPGLFESRFDRYLRNEAIAWAQAHPGEVLRLAGVKLVRLWNLWPNEAQFRRPLVRLVVLGTYLPVIVLALVGIWRYARRGWPYALCLLPAVYLSLLHMVFVSSIRYRQPAMLGLIVLAAGVVVEVWRDRRSAARDG